MNIPHPCAGESRLGGGGGGTKIAPQTALSSTSGACSYSYQQILFRAIKASIKGAILGYGIRGGLDLLLKLISVSRGKISLSEALRKSLLGEDAFRFTSFFGVYGLLWKLTNGLLVKWRGTDRKNDKWNGFISGAVAGTALICESPHRRVSIAQQMLIRGLQVKGCRLRATDLNLLPYGPNNNDALTDLRQSNFIL